MLDFLLWKLVEYLIIIIRKMLPYYQPSSLSFTIYTLHASMHVSLSRCQASNPSLQLTSSPLFCLFCLVASCRRPLRHLRWSRSLLWSGSSCIVFCVEVGGLDDLFYYCSGLVYFWEVWLQVWCFYVVAYYGLTYYSDWLVGLFNETE